jgi:hypothetical protein
MSSKPSDLIKGYLREPLSLTDDDVLYEFFNMHTTLAINFYNN